MKSLLLTGAQSQQFYGDTQPTQRSQELTQGPILALELIGTGVQQAMIDATSGASAPRGSAGADLASALRHVHVGSSSRGSELELDYLFANASLRPPATFASCTLGVIKPHAVQSGEAGAIIDTILRAGFDISALQQFQLDAASAGEFLEVYRGVLPEYGALVEQFASGSCIALEIRAPPQRLVDADGKSVSVVSAFRDLCGPADPEVGKHIRPRSIRSVFGFSKVKNAIHATDLDEDGVLEAEFFFDVLQTQFVQTSTQVAAKEVAGAASTMGRR